MGREWVPTGVESCSGVGLKLRTECGHLLTGMDCV